MGKYVIDLILIVLAVGISANLVRLIVRAELDRKFKDD